MNYEEFKFAIKYFLEKNNWQENIREDNTISYLKNYNPNFVPKIRSSYVLNDKKFLFLLQEVFKSLNLEERKYNSITNPYSDTDFIIAGLQTINPILSGQEEVRKKSWFSFQPVIRLKEKEICGVKEGYFTSFVNVCTIDIDTSIEEYLGGIDKWITILSKCSLHSSGLEIILKKQTTTFDGFGVEFNYKGIELGQANFYQMNINGKKVHISDFGFGYERLLWAINGGINFFAPLIDKYQLMYGNMVRNDRLRTVSLISMSGIKPSSVGIGKHSRKLISEISNLIGNEDVAPEIKRYYNFYSQFITPKCDYNQTLIYIRNEILMNQKKSILESRGFNISDFYGKTLEEICEIIFLNTQNKELQRVKKV